MLCSSSAKLPRKQLGNDILVSERWEKDRDRRGDEKERVSEHMYV